MKKLLTLLLILIIAPVIGGIYGAIHDQLTYTISPEYYTKFKFYQFELVDGGTEAILPNPRLGAAIVGVMATWWMGVPIGIVLGLTGLIHPTWKRMFKITVIAMAVTVVVAFVTGLIGLFYGYFTLSNEGKNAFLDWYIPENLIDVKSFIMVGSMHNFSYIGGLTGLIAGIIYSINRNFRFNSASKKATQALPISP